MNSLPIELAARSLSPDELVLSADDAMDALVHFAESGVHVLGWEAWIRYADGTVGHPPTVIGSVDLSADPDPIGFCRDTIREEKARWDEDEHPDGREMYFCIAIRAA